MDKSRLYFFARVGSKICLEYGKCLEMDGKMGKSIKDTYPIGEKTKGSKSDFFFLSRIFFYLQYDSVQGFTFLVFPALFRIQGSTTKFNTSRSLTSSKTSSSKRQLPLYHPLGRDPNSTVTDIFWYMPWLCLPCFFVLNLH